MIDGKRLEAFCALACVCVPWLVACQQGIRTRGPTSTAGQSNGRVWSSWLLGGALVADGIDVDAPFIAQQFQHMGRLSSALMGLPIGGYFFGPRPLYFRLSGLFATSGPQGAFRSIAISGFRGSAPHLDPWQHTGALWVSL